MTRSNAALTHGFLHAVCVVSVHLVEELVHAVLEVGAGLELAGDLVDDVHGPLGLHGRDGGTLHAAFQELVVQLQTHTRHM